MVNKSGYVYLMRPIGRNVYKIGETINIDNRIKRKEKQVDYKLECVAAVFVDDCWHIENKLHRTYERYRLAGEWFVLPSEVVDNFDKIVAEAVGNER